MKLVENSSTKSKPANSNYNSSKYNAVKYGIFSKHTVMHWENKDDYDSILNDLIEEYQPNNITERHLIVELANIIWSKMRLKYAEKASFQSILNNQVNPKYSSFHNECADDALLLRDGNITNSEVKKHLVSNQEKTQLEINNLQEKVNSCIELIKKLQDESINYESACNDLHQDIKEKWEDVKMYDDEGNQYDSTNLTSEDLENWLKRQNKSYEEKIYQLENRDKIKEQVLGRTFLSDGTMDKYMRYENHLDKKFEKTLAMFFKLREIRSNGGLTKSVL